MYISFEKLSDNARIWIYPSNRKLSDQEVKEILVLFEKFFAQWTAHNKKLLASVQIPYNRFIVIGLDSDFQSPSGCSIDSSVHFIQNIEKSYKIVLLDKMNVTFKQGAYLVYKSLTEFKKMIKNGSINKKTIVFNNLVNDVREYKTQWETSISNSWHSRFLNK